MTKSSKKPSDKNKTSSNIQDCNNCTNSTNTNMDLNKNKKPKNK